MRSAIIFLSILLIAWSDRVKAGHNDEKAAFIFALSGIPVTIGSTIIFPLIGRARYEGKNPPYWKAVGFTFLASTTGMGMVWWNADNGGEIGPHHYDILYPALFGAVATYFTYRLSSPKTDNTTSALWQYAPQVSVSPFARGGSITLNWFF